MSGTLEHLHLSPVPLGYLCLVRTLAGSVALAPLVLGGSISLALATGHLYVPSARELAIVGLVLLGSAGTGYIVAGMALLGVRTGPWLGVALLVAMVLPMVDVAKLPVAGALVWVLPASSGVRLLRSLVAVAANAGPVEPVAAALAISILINGLAGFAALGWAERRAKEIGSLTRYDAGP